MKPNVRIVKVSDKKEKDTYYKIQERLFGFLWWYDLTEPQYNMIYPTFDTLEDAERWVERMYFVQETVVKEYTTINR